jgi:acyl-CoA synthetase (AMP-forming)/AMP-acid ligase II
MIEIGEDTTIGQAFERAVAIYGERPFLAVPSGQHRAYHKGGYSIDFATAGREVGAITEALRAAGFGHGHRVALLLDNRPEHFLIKLALNRLGAICVPVNPDYRASEIAYLLEHAEVDLALVAPERRDQLGAAMSASTHKAPVALFDDLGSLSRPGRPGRGDPVTAASEASILYTSGTTGRPKGCVLSHGYELASGAWYATRGHLAAFRPQGERIYNPLPVYHVNSSILSFFGAVLSGSCQIQADRFHPERWWPEIAETEATIVHYLGVIVPLLLNMPTRGDEKALHVRFGIGAGVEPQLHGAFEERFGFPLIEVWGMTEMVRVLLDHESPRQVGTRAFGRPADGVEVRVVDADDRDVAPGQPGEMVLRHSEATPRKHFFSGYLKDEKATAEAWRGGWFHTGDTVRQDGDGMLHFVDRKKNIIRRSGENIAAAEIEAVLQAHPLVKAVAVLAVPDEIREEEVFAAIVLMDPSGASKATAELLFRHCNAELAYFKAPGWLHFLDALPTTGTQKIQKHSIYPAGVDPRSLPGVFDLRDRKKRRPTAEAS